jgi:hypothetical protein
MEKKASKKKPQLSPYQSSNLKQEAVGRLVGLRGAKLGKGAFKGLW